MIVIHLERQCAQNKDHFEKKVLTVSLIKRRHTDAQRTVDGPVSLAFVARAEGRPEGLEAWVTGVLDQVTAAPNLHTSVLGRTRGRTGRSHWQKSSKICYTIVYLNKRV